MRYGLAEQTKSSSAAIELFAAYVQLTKRWRQPIPDSRTCYTETPVSKVVWCVGDGEWWDVG